MLLIRLLEIKADQSFLCYFLLPIEILENVSFEPHSATGNEGLDDLMILCKLITIKSE